MKFEPSPEDNKGENCCLHYNGDVKLFEVSKSSRWYVMKGNIHEQEQS